MTRRFSGLWVLVLAALLGLASGAAATKVRHSGKDASPERLKRVTNAAWVYRTTDLAKMVRDVDLILVGTPATVSAGRTVLPANGSTSLNFEIVDFNVHERLKGVVKSSSVSVERVAQDRVRPQIAIDYDGGPYEAGKLYVLFLNKQPESSLYYLVNDDGRFEIGPNDQLRAVGNAPIAARWNRRQWADLRTTIRGMVR